MVGMNDMMLWMRILTRYLVGALGGLLIYAGLPADIVNEVKNDPEILAGIGLAVAALVEWITVVVRKRGGKT